MSSEKWLLLSIALERPFFSAGDPAGRREVIMGLFDKIVSMVGDNISGGTENKGLLQRAVSLIASPEVGGLSGLIEKFRNGGLGDVAGSWVGKGANLPVSGEQVINALGSDKIREIASNLGITNTEVADGLASALPQLIDKLTPDGVIPEDSVLKQGLGLLTSRFLKG
jgi:uncharacterized protein YidB (DUF937 family)